VGGDPSAVFVIAFAMKLHKVYHRNPGLSSGFFPGMGPLSAGKSKIQRKNSFGQRKRLTVHCAHATMQKTVEEA